MTGFNANASKPILPFEGGKRPESPSTKPRVHRKLERELPHGGIGKKLVGSANLVNNRLL